jgi:hypothetical protein
MEFFSIVKLPLKIQLVVEPALNLNTVWHIIRESDRVKA